MTDFDLRDAAKLALEALEWEDCNDDAGLEFAQKKAIAALKRALAEDAIEKIVEREELKLFCAEQLSAIVISYLKEHRKKEPCPNCASLMEQNTELDKKLSQWVGLTEEEFDQMLADAGFTQTDLMMIGACVDDIRQMIEAKLKEKNR